MNIPHVEVYIIAPTPSHSYLPCEMLMTVIAALIVYCVNPKHVIMLGN